MEIIPIKTRIFKESDDLFGFLRANLPLLKSGDIVVVTSKIVALAQGRTVLFSPKEKYKWIKKESDQIIKTPWAYLTLREKRWCVSAGIDESNGRGRLIFLPNAPFSVAKNLQKKLKKFYGLKKIGVLITDTRSTPLRAGVIGSTLAYFGFSPMKDYVGKKDLFGRKFKFVKSNIVDALAAAAGVTMGEGAERKPIAVIRNANVYFTQKKQSLAKVLIRPEKDLYRFIYRRIRSTS
ncbi:MAG: coenzyme F420-0:L-glutamate ligase [Patescibacteria group bacterium]|nr:coenzyme F420-0:L-glutamate ligase [Patescibacteria group bacterium]MCL5258019.1 coenzyme F420-0:L-glutamate ligase [Patescibacteria group bacterium]